MCKTLAVAHCDEKLRDKMNDSHSKCPDPTLGPLAIGLHVIAKCPIKIFLGSWQDKDATEVEKDSL